MVCQVHIAWEVVHPNARTIARQRGKMKRSLHRRVASKPHPLLQRYYLQASRAETYLDASIQHLLGFKARQERAMQKWA
jgi:hypothetical protein